MSAKLCLFRNINSNNTTKNLKINKVMWHGSMDCLNICGTGSQVRIASYINAIKTLGGQRILLVKILLLE